MADVGNWAPGHVSTPSSSKLVAPPSPPARTLIRRGDSEQVPPEQLPSLHDGATPHASTWTPSRPVRRACDDPSSTMATVTTTTPALKAAPENGRTGGGQSFASTTTNKFRAVYKARPSAGPRLRPVNPYSAYSYNQSFPGNSGPNQQYPSFHKTAYHRGEHNQSHYHSHAQGRPSNQTNGFASKGGQHGYRDMKRGTVFKRNPKQYSNGFHHTATDKHPFTRGAHAHDHVLGPQNSTFKKSHSNLHRAKDSWTPDTTVDTSSENSYYAQPLPKHHHKNADSHRPKDDPEPELSDPEEEENHKDYRKGTLITGPESNTFAG